MERYRTIEEFISKHNLDYHIEHGFYDEDLGLDVLLHKIDFRGNEKAKCEFNEYFPNFIDYFENGDIGVAEIGSVYN